MATNLPEALARLSAGERGFILAVATAGARGGGGDDVRTEPGRALVNDERERIEAAIQALGALPAAARAAVLSLFARDVVAPFPPGAEQCDPSLIRSALAAEPSEIIAALVAGLPAVFRGEARAICTSRGENLDRIAVPTFRPEVLAELRRLVFGSLGSTVSGARR